MRRTRAGSTNQSACSTRSLRRISAHLASVVMLLTIMPLTLSLNGCASLVDAPPPTAQPILDVRSLYYPLDSTKLVYNYIKVDSDQYRHQLNTDTLSIFMQSRACPKGTPPTFGPNNTPVYSTLFVPHHSFPFNIAYAVDANQAFGGLVFDDRDHELGAIWVDLQAPIQQGASWGFSTGGDQQHNDSVEATVAFFDASVTMHDTTYDHVTAVHYLRMHQNDSQGHVSIDSTTSTSWYAQGVGLIYWASYDDAEHRINELKLLSVAHHK